MILICHLWIAGEGLGSSRKGIADPIMAGNVKLDNLGVGAQQPGAVTPEDDIYEQYKKRMMLGYRYRPNPLVKTLCSMTTSPSIYFCSCGDISTIFFYIWKPGVVFV